MLSRILILRRTVDRIEKSNELPPQWASTSSFLAVSGSDKCPSSHPYVYFNGQYCCATRRELNMNMMYGWGWGWGGIPGGQCSGGALRVTSMCCENDNYVRCPEFNCA